MDILLALIITFILLIAGVYMNIFMAIPLFGGLVIFSVITMKRGYSLKETSTMIYRGGSKAAVVLKIFILIGAIIPVWLAAGTVPSIVYYGLKLISPKLFIVAAFGVNCLVSFLTGTSFGAAGTSGIAFMVMGRSGGVNLNLLAGAIIAGAYFGDRCSPVSSSAFLVAGLTGTEIYSNVKRMFTKSIVPLAAALILYTVFSYLNPIVNTNSIISSELVRTFKIGIVPMIPAVILLICASFRFNVKLSMLLSIVSGIVIALFYQKFGLLKLALYIASGFELDKGNALYNIVKGGGIISMIKLSVIVFISSAFSGIFEETGMLKPVEERLDNIKSCKGLFAAVVLLSIATSVFGCTQTIAVILTYQIVKNAYSKRNLKGETLMLDIEDTAIVIAPLIPWNLAGLAPASNLGIGPGYIPYCFYLFLIPLWAFMRHKGNHIM